MKEWEYVKLDHLNMLVPAEETLLRVFGYTKDRIRDEILYYQKTIGTIPALGKTIGKISF